MLLREPDGNSAQLFNNGNVSVQQQTDKNDTTNSNTIVENVEENSSADTLTLSCRENQLREALEKSLELNINNTISYSDNGRFNNINSDNLSLELNGDINLASTILDYSPDEGLFDYEDEDHSYSSSNTSIHDDDDKMLENSVSDDSYSNDTLSFHIPRGIHNPNYPGFQHLAYTLQECLVECPNKCENSDLSCERLECNDRFFERLGDLQQYDYQRNSEYIIEPNNNNNNNNNNETDSSFKNLINDSETYYATDTKTVVLQKGVQKNVFQSDTEKVISNCSDRNKNILSVAVKPIEDLSLNNSEDESNENSDSAISSTEKDVLTNLDSSLIDDENSNTDFQDDFVELKQEIYESIQKPIATTLENISEVINNVIRYIVEEHDVHQDIWKQSIDNSSLQHLIGKSIQKLHEEDKLNLTNLHVNSETFSLPSNDDENMAKVDLKNQSDTNPEVLDQIKTHMDDAYMSNVAENLFVQNDQKSTMEFTLDDLPNIQYDINFNENPEKSVSPVALKQKSNDEITPKCVKISKKHDKMKTNAINSDKINRYESRRKVCDSSPDNPPTSSKTNKKTAADASGSFDVYNIETAMPSIDLDAIENHLRAAREEERRRRNDREEIRRRLAMGTEHEDYYTLGDRPGRKPSLQARLQSGMNLQICFMNETASDTESPSDLEVSNTTDKISTKYRNSKPKSERKSKTVNNSKTEKGSGIVRPNTLAIDNALKCTPAVDLSDQLDFFECQARLQTEARMALAQAKEIAHIQMEIERQRQEKSPITEMLRSSLEKAGVQFLGDRRRVSRQMLTDINITQLQVIVNELHTQIEFLNESLVELLIARDELHMGQDSMLVDIEDLTRHLGAKDISYKTTDANEKCASDKHIAPEKNLQFRTSSTAATLASK